MFKIEQYTNMPVYLYSKFWIDNTWNISKDYPWQVELQLFKVFLCIFLYFQGLFYNKCKKVNVYILESKQLERINNWFPRGDRGGTVHWMYTFLVHTRTYSMFYSHEQLKCRQLTSYQPSSYCLYIHRHVSVGVNVVGVGCDLSSSRNVWGQFLNQVA